MNKLKNLVPDLEEMFDAGKQPSDEDLEVFAQDVLSVIKESFKPRKLSSKEALRFSSIGRPDIQLWYTYNKPEIAERLHLSTRIKFMYVDLI